MKRNVCARPLLPRGDVIPTVRPVISLSARNDARPRAFRWTVDGKRKEFGPGGSRNVSLSLFAIRSRPHAR